MNDTMKVVLILAFLLLLVAVGPALLPTGYHVGNRGYIYPASLNIEEDSEYIAFCSDPLYYDTQIGRVRAGSRCITLVDNTENGHGNKFICGFPPIVGYPCYGYDLYRERTR